MTVARSSPRRSGPPRTTMFVLSTFIMLAGCGRVGMLEQPAPLYGAKAKAEYAARKARAAAAAKAAKDDGEPEALAPDTPGADQPIRGPQTMRAQPVPGMATPPNSPGPGGVLPDPFNRPQ